MTGRDEPKIPKRSFPIFLQEELRKQDAWSVTKWGDGRLTGQLIFIFRGKGALKVQLAKSQSERQGIAIYRDSWEWHGEVGGIMGAVQRYRYQFERGDLPPPMKEAKLQEGKLFADLVPDASLTPIESCLDRCLGSARHWPKRSRRLNKDGSLRRLRYDFDHGNSLKLYGDGRLRIYGHMAPVFDAVMAAEEAYTKSLPPPPPPPLPKWQHPRDRRKRKTLR